MRSVLSILLVEDNEDEERMAVRAIRRSEVGREVFVARDGIEACEVLFDPLRTDLSLVILDLHLPKLSGFEVLERVRANPQTSRLPVVVFSSSDDERDIARSFDLHANSYVHKPVDPDLYESSLRVLLYYWAAVNRTICPPYDRGSKSKAWGPGCESLVGEVGDLAAS